MRLKLDENITSAAVPLLRTFGHDADTVADEHLVGARDEDLARSCRDERRLLFTFDVGFGDFRTYPPGSHAGIVVLRLKDQRPDAVLALLRRLLATEDFDGLAGALVVVSNERVRIRRPQSDAPPSTEDPGP